MILTFIGILFSKRCIYCPVHTTLDDAESVDIIIYVLDNHLCNLYNALNLIPRSKVVFIEMRCNQKCILCNNLYAEDTIKCLKTGLRNGGYLLSLTYLPRPKDVQLF